MAARVSQKGLMTQPLNRLIDKDCNAPSLTNNDEVTNKLGLSCAKLRSASLVSSGNLEQCEVVQVN